MHASECAQRGERCYRERFFSRGARDATGSLDKRKNVWTVFVGLKFARRAAPRPVGSRFDRLFGPTRVGGTAFFFPSLGAAPFLIEKPSGGSVARK